MPFEIKCACISCKKSQTIIVSAIDKQQVCCPTCGSAMLETRDVPGYLYILTNPSMPGLVKIGITTRSVSDRVSELDSATGVPGKFTVEAYFESSDPIAHECSVHSSLAAVRMKGREFFRISLEDALDAVQKVTGNAPLEGDVAILNDSRATLKKWMETPKWP